MRYYLCLQCPRYVTAWIALKYAKICRQCCIVTSRARPTQFCFVHKVVKLGHIIIQICSLVYLTETKQKLVKNQIKQHNNFWDPMYIQCNTFRRLVYLDCRRPYSYMSHTWTTITIDLLLFTCDAFQWCRCSIQHGTERAFAYTENTDITVNIADLIELRR